MNIHEENNMNIHNAKHIQNTGSAMAIYNYILQTRLADSPHRLKMITLSVGNFPIDAIDWALKVSNRSFNNLLERKITKKAIRQSLRITFKTFPQKYKQIKRWTWSLHRKSVKDVITGGWRKIELERVSRREKIYNLHIHILCECSFIPQPILSVLWESALSKHLQEITCSSEGIVHIQDVKNTEEDITKVINYMAKPIPVARRKRFSNIRLYATFGKWYNRDNIYLS
jgi:hypothetical protein